MESQDACMTIEPNAAAPHTFVFTPAPEPFPLAPSMGEGVTFVGETTEKSLKGLTDFFFFFLHVLEYPLK